PRVPPTTRGRTAPGSRPPCSATTACWRRRRASWACRARRCTGAWTASACVATDADALAATPVPRPGRHGAGGGLRRGGGRPRDVAGDAGRRAVERVGDRGGRRRAAAVVAGAARVRAGGLPVPRARRDGGQ